VALSALGAGRRGGAGRRDLAGGALLRQAAELLPQGMRRLLQDSVVGHALERALLALLLDFDLRQATQKLKFFLFQGRLSRIHVIAPRS